MRASSFCYAVNDKEKSDFGQIKTAKTIAVLSYRAFMTSGDIDLGKLENIFGFATPIHAVKEP